MRFEETVYGTVESIEGEGGKRKINIQTNGGKDREVPIGSFELERKLEAGDEIVARYVQTPGWLAALKRLFSGEFYDLVQIGHVTKN
jgi:hypothetical protein